MSVPSSFEVGSEREPEPDASTVIVAEAEPGPKATVWVARCETVTLKFDIEYDLNPSLTGVTNTRLVELTGMRRLHPRSCLS